MGIGKDTDPELLASRLRAGSAAAVSEVRSHVRKILSFRGYRIPSEDRRDLEQEIMTQVWQAVNRSGFDPALGFAKFIEVVTTRRCIDWLRARRPEADMPTDREAAAADSPEHSTLAGERARLARAAMAQLSEPCRDLIYLRVSMDRSYREIARILDRREGALRVQMHRCIQRLREILDETGAGAATDGERGSR